MGVLAPARYKMKDLCERTGLERQTIHFYIQEGLLPVGEKTGRNTAHYGDDHVERLQLIRKLQEERFLPLRAIRAVLGGKTGEFSPRQRLLLADVKRRLDEAPGGAALVRRAADSVPVAEIARTAGVPVEDVLELVRAGLLAAQDRNGTLFVRRDDAWLVDAWAELERAGIGRQHGFSPADLTLVDDAVSALFERERDMFLDRFDSLPPEEIARTLERAVPILSDLLARWHAQKARDTFTAFADDGRVTPKARNQPRPRPAKARSAAR